MALRDFHYEQTSKQLFSQIALVESHFLRLLKKSDFRKVESSCRRFSRSTDSSFAVTTSDGKPITPPNANPEWTSRINQTHSGLAQPSSGYQQRVFWNAKGFEEYMMVSKPLFYKNVYLGSLHITRVAISMQNSLWKIYVKIVLGFLFVIGLLAVASWRITRSVAKPLETMQAYAQRIAMGDFSQQIQFRERVSREAFFLGETLNTIAQQLKDRIKTILKQNSEQRAIFASMTEGVVAIDRKHRIMNLNEAAAQQLRLFDKPQVHGMKFSSLLN